MRQDATKLVGLGHALCVAGLLIGACGLPNPHGGGGGRGGAGAGGTPSTDSGTLPVCPTEPGRYPGERCTRGTCASSADCGGPSSRCYSNQGTFCTGLYPDGCENARCVYKVFTSGCVDFTPASFCACEATPSAETCATCCDAAFTLPAETSACACGPEGACAAACSGNKLCGGTGQTTPECAECVWSATSSGGACAGTGCQGCYFFSRCLNACQARR